jgi:hypothetical protein
MIAYVLNVYLFYFLIFCAIVILLKDFSMGVFYLLIHFLGDPYNYFTIVEELLPGVCLIILFLALLRSEYLKISNKGAIVFGIVLLYFCVHSHPLAMISLFGVLPLFLYQQRKKVLNNWKVYAVFVFVGLVLLVKRFIFINHYDLSRIEEGKGLLLSAIELLQWEYLKKMLYYLWSERVMFALSCILTLAYLAYQRKFFRIALLLSAAFAVTAIFNTMVDAQHFTDDNLRQYSWDRWSLPIRFIFFGAFSLYFLDDLKDLRGKYIFLLLFAFLFVWRSFGYVQSQTEAQAAVSQTVMLINECQQRGISKVIVCWEELDCSIPVHYYSYLGSLVFSAKAGWKEHVQIVYEMPDLDYGYLLTAEEELFMVCRHCDIKKIENLNLNYYRLKKEPFQYLHLNP